LPHLAVFKVTLRPRRPIASKRTTLTDVGREHRVVNAICVAFFQMEQKTTISERQMLALYRGSIVNESRRPDLCGSRQPAVSNGMVESKRRLHEPIGPLQIEAVEPEVAAQ
jgi:hypothetical protein